MELIAILAIITFIILLICALFMLNNFYICDSHSCKAFKQAGKVSSVKGTKEYVIALLGELCNDGIWPFPYIGASILTPLSLWFVGIPLTVKNFAIVFFVSFVVIYFMFTFFGHHYGKVIAKYTAEYIRSNCTNPSTDEYHPPISDTHIESGRIVYDDHPPPPPPPPRDITPNNNSPSGYSSNSEVNNSKTTASEVNSSKTTGSEVNSSKTTGSEVNNPSMLRNVVGIMYNDNLSFDVGRNKIISKYDDNLVCFSDGGSKME